MSEDMIERVARYLCKVSYIDAADPAEELIQPQVDKMWGAWRGEARELLELMREPTETMIDAAYTVEPDGSAPALSEAWKAMIDSALKKEASVAQEMSA